METSDRHYIPGTRTKVLFIVLDAQRGRTIEEMQHSYPHLSAQQIQDAMDYYEANRDAIDRQIAKYNLTYSLTNSPTSAAAEEGEKP